MVDNQCKYLYFRVTKETPRDGGGTQNRQKSATDRAARAESSGLELCRVVTEENEVKYDCRQKKENANICKIDFPVLCTFTLFNADFCTFLH
jgi:hypothetical protein